MSGNAFNKNSYKRMQIVNKEFIYAMLGATAGSLYQHFLSTPIHELSHKLANDALTNGHAAIQADVFDNLTALGHANSIGDFFSKLGAFLIDKDSNHDNAEGKTYTSDDLNRLELTWGKTPVMQ